MKKSEFIKSREAVWSDRIYPPTYRINDDVEAAEAAGVVWDPEDEPLPEWLRVSEITNQEGCLRPHLAIDGFAGLIRSDFMVSYYAEAVRRYNAWHDLRALAEEWERLGKPSYAAKIYRILKGPENG